MKETDTGNTKKFGGEGNPPVEIDETYVGGKRRHGDNVLRLGGYRKDSKKVPVVAMVERGAGVRTKIVPRVTQKNLKTFLHDNIAKGSTVNTDQLRAYPALVYPLVSENGNHHVVNHTFREYARKATDGTIAHVNNCESFFSLLKRGIMGTFHCVSKEHLHRYCDEFAFRWNTRRLNDGERLAAAIKNADGKRLLYSDAIGG